MNIKIIDRYIAKTVLMAIGLITLMLIGLQVFILFVSQLDAIGKGNYSLLAVFMYVLLQVPYEVYLFFPVASLLGVLMGLGMLANHSELVVMQASGMSVGQIIKSVFKVTLILVFIVTVLGETALPPLVKFAEHTKAFYLGGGQALNTERGLWLRRDNNFINIGVVENPTELSSIYQYQFDDKHRLVLARFIKKAQLIDGLWQLHDVSESQLSPTRVKVQKKAKSVWSIHLPPALLSLGYQQPDEMSLWRLNRYIQLQKQSQVDASRYELSFWHRLIQPVSTAVMMMLAIPFIFGPLRSASLGAKFLAGCTVGFGFHMLNQFFGPLSQVYQLPPIISAWGPTFLFAAIAFLLLHKTT